MNRPLIRVTIACLTLLGGSGALTTPARADPSSRSATAAVAAPVSVDPPVVPAQGTMIMVYGSGWVGHSARSQEGLAQRGRELFVQRGWRVVSVDYREGAAGLQDVLNVAGAELERKSSDGPLCIYGESSGGHLALVAASRLRAVDCVIGLGTPTDLALYHSEGSVSSDPRVQVVASQIGRLFGTTSAQLAPWDATSLAPALHADVLLLREGDDTLVPAIHNARFQQSRPTTQTVDLQAGDPADPSTAFAHGTASAAGRAEYASAVGAFVDRAVSARRAARRAARTGCAQVNRSVVQSGLKGLWRALRCLTRKDPQTLRAGASGWRRTSVRFRGEVTAARIWAGLRASTSGRRALVATARRQARITIKTSDRTRVTLRATR